MLPSLIGMVYECTRLLHGIESLELLLISGDNRWGHQGVPERPDGTDTML